MLDLWAQLSPELKTVACGTLAGVVLWAVQKWWTNCPLLGWLGPDSGTAKKRLTAVLLAVGAGVGAAYTAGGDVQVGDRRGLGRVHRAGRTAARLGRLTA
jgi:hypothetical protein